MSDTTNAFNFIHSMEIGDEIKIKFQGKDSVLNYEGTSGKVPMYRVQSVAGIEWIGCWGGELDDMLNDKTIEIVWENVEDRLLTRWHEKEYSDNVRDERLLTRWHEEEYLELVMRES